MNMSQQKKHVLIVEDNVDDQVLMSQIIEKVMHHTCTIAKDGFEALNIATKKNIDLILLDLRLPKLYGWNVAQLLRQNDEYKDIPIIAVTAYDHPKTRQDALSFGCDIYITKPIDIDSLVTVLSMYLPRISDG